MIREISDFSFSTEDCDFDPRYKGERLNGFPETLFRVDKQFENEHGFILVTLGSDFEMTQDHYDFLYLSKDMHVLQKLTAYTPATERPYVEQITDVRIDGPDRLSVNFTNGIGFLLRFHPPGGKRFVLDWGFRFNFCILLFLVELFITKTAFSLLTFPTLIYAAIFRLCVVGISSGVALTDPDGKNLK